MVGHSCFNATVCYVQGRQSNPHEHVSYFVKTVALDLVEGMLLPACQSRTPIRWKVAC